MNGVERSSRSPRCSRAGVALWMMIPLFLLAPATLAAQEGGVPRVPKVLLIGIDGVRPDVLREVQTPHLNDLIRTGAFSDRALTGRAGTRCGARSGSPAGRPACGAAS